MKIGIYYGSTTGNAQSVALALAGALGCPTALVKSARAFDAAEAAGCDLLVLGSSTWGDGELQDDWQGKIGALAGAALSGRKAAVFGVGDGNGWADTFVDAMRDLYDAAKTAGAEMVGGWPVDGYSFSSSRAVVEGRFVGLAIDESNEAAKTPERISAWAKQLRKECGCACGC